MNRYKLQMTFLFATILLCSGTYANHLTAKYLFAAQLDGSQEVPAVTTNAIGAAFLTLNSTRDTLCIEATVNGLSGPITDAHIHEGAIGVGGPAVLSLMSYVNGNRIKATISGSALTQTFIQKMFMGDYYINIHTTANMNGEIRGQILLEKDMGIMVQLTGAEENPPVATAATGLGFLKLSHDRKNLSFNIVFDGLSSSFTGAHIHKAVAGVNGGIVEDLAPFVTGNMIMGSVDPSAYLTALLTDSLYINVHTTNHGGGEIRGQLRMMPHYLYFNANMNGAQEVPPVTTSAMGEAVVRLNYTFDTLWYNVQANGLSGPITVGHFHLGAPGVSGGPVLGFLPGDINGNVVSGMTTGALLVDTFLQYLLDGSLYINLHTAANTGGEIRGQVYRAFREGYTFHINGAQETPAVTSTAYGTGLVSVDRDQTNAHFLMTVNGITPSMLHFHGNPPDVPGPIIRDLTSLYANGLVTGYWLNTDATMPFTPSIASMFRNDSVYVNFHTTANPSGEIRGNLKRTLCVEIPTSITTIGGIKADVKLYPNPAQKFARLEINLAEKLNSEIQLTDLMGKKIWTRTVSLQPGFNSINIPVVNISPGIYSVSILTQGGQENLKLLKE